MKILLGWGLDGPTFTAREVDGGAAIGEATWGPGALLRDLELRLGWPKANPSRTRVPELAARIQTLGAASAFYAKSFATDPLGTAHTLITWRDALVDAGWDGRSVHDGGDRLDALAELEAAGASAEDEALGRADRTRRVERELAETKQHLYDEIALVERRAFWSRRWQSIFTLLEAAGTAITQAKLDLPAPTGESDLALLQRLIRGDLDAKTLDLPARVRGDGSLLLLRGETPTELASLTAGILGATRGQALVVRGLDSAPLESALERHGLSGQGHVGESAWRPAMQVLPLAIELAYEPRDPLRVLELLTLPVGPFQGLVGAELARAVARQPGVGGQEWRRRKQRLVEILRAATLRRERDAGKPDAEAARIADDHVAERLQRIADWFEAPGAGREGASRETLLALAGRVQRWLEKRLRAAEEPSLYAGAFAQARAFASAIEADRRPLFRREDARHLLDSVVRARQSLALSTEGAGRPAHVTHPGAILAPADTVVFWGFVAGTERRTPIPPWNRAELRALGKAGVAFPDTTRLLSIETNAWRRGVLAARERVVFVVPDTVKGEAKSAHPLWDEIAARLRLDTNAEARLTRNAARVLRLADASLAPLETLPPLALPRARATWHVPIDAFADVEEDRKTSATALELLASCPLAWVLARRAKIRPGAIAKVASGPLLHGSLSHRLVEDLHAERAFDLQEADFVARAEAALDQLIATEGATLRLPGNAFERSQLERQILRAMRALFRYVAASGYRIAGVEEDIATDAGVGVLLGRLDVRLEDADGKPAILDLKWGSSSYEARIVKGTAIQLAVYARALRHANQGEMPPAGYFSLSTGRVLTADVRMRAPKLLAGPTLDETWRRVDRTSTEVARALASGEVHVAARRALPLLERLGVREEDREQHFGAEPDEPCTYCPYPALCGRQWEAMP